MIPIYFPFTHMSPEVFNNIIAFFPGVAVYQPSSETVPEAMKKLAMDDRIEIRIPIISNENAFKTLLEEFHLWSELHQLSDKRNIKRHEWYSGSRTPSQIRTEVQRRLRGESTNDQSDPLLNARQFLVFAQEFDLQNESLQNDLRAANDLETEFLTNLTGEGPGVEPNTNLLYRTDTEPYMIQERLAAWCLLAKHDSKVPGILITPSQTAFDHFMDMVSKGSPVIETERLPSEEGHDEGTSITENALTAYLADLINSPLPENANLKIIDLTSANYKNLRISIGLIPNKSPYDCFSTINSQQPISNPTETLQKNTVLAFIRSDQ